jgi:hypothetical protein
MNSRHTIPTGYWKSEFERIHVMMAARLRGERHPGERTSSRRKPGPIE